ncbi:MAG TPA: alpha/beta hydrolase-fold protein [Mucilaginibacter sp.]|jgi:predicted alpha/beta superfamily hydrolase|nr:alpha/beta hydrolase-fold protein [Mucilaginibacter sp.]
MYLKKQALLLLLMLLTAGICHAQQSVYYQEPVEYEIPAKHLPFPRKYWVSLPVNYERTNLHYPIVFLFDGSSNAVKRFAATADQLGDTMPPCIIVGVVQQNRTLELIPPYEGKRYPYSDIMTSDLFFDFLKQELLPELNKNFRTQDFRIGVGHSLGGLFVANCFARDPGFFNGIIATSPAIVIARDSAVYADINRQLHAKLTSHVFFFWSVGTEGEGEQGFRPGAIMLSRQFAEYTNNMFTYQFLDLPGKSHGTTSQPTMPAALTFVFKDWDPADWYKEISKKVDPERVYINRKLKVNRIYDFDTDPIEDRLLNAVGKRYLALKNYDKAQQYFERAIRANASVAGVYDELGTVQENMHNYTAALNSYKQAMAKLDKTDANYQALTESYQKDIKRVEGLVKQ